jgi:hypothetical protein
MDSIMELVRRYSTDTTWHFGTPDTDDIIARALRHRTRSMPEQEARAGLVRLRIWRVLPVRCVNARR